MMMALSKLLVKMLQNLSMVVCWALDLELFSQHIITWLEWQQLLLDIPS
jgi:hypothetical protein